MSAKMTDPTMARTSIGFGVFAIAVFVWANIDCNRFIKFWMLRPAPYMQRVKVVFRLFFLAFPLTLIRDICHTVLRTLSDKLRGQSDWFGTLRFISPRPPL